MKAKPKATVRDPGFTELLGRQALRYLLLRRIYEICEGGTTHHTTPGALREVDGKDYFAVKEALIYLRDAKLIDANKYEIYQIRLTHKGIAEVEKAIRNPAKGTEHFEPSVISAFAKDSTGRMISMRIVN